MNTIKDLYYGKIKPNEMEFRKVSENDALLMQIIKIEETLNKTLTKEQIHLFEKYRDAQLQLSDLTEFQAFCKGFKLGANLILDTIDLV